MGKAVGRFADGADNVITPRGTRRIRGENRKNIVMRVIERGADQIVHSGIQNHEALGFARFNINHPRHEDARVGSDQPAGLEDELNVETFCRLCDHFSVSIRVGGRRIVQAVGDAEPAAEIGAGDSVPLAREDLRSDPRLV